MAVAKELGVEAEIVLYMKAPPDRKTLEMIVDGLEEPVDGLVRKDSRFEKLGLVADDYLENPDAVVDLLVKQKALLQRPVVVMGKRAIIGRPKSRIVEFLQG